MNLHLNDGAMTDRNAAQFRRRAFGIAATLAVLAASLSTAAFAHHGLGRFDRTKQVDFTGVIKGIDFVNPHSYLHFDAVGPDGKTIAMRCEMRAATLLRRSGWTPEMFVVGAKAVVHAFAHRDDPASCYLEDITIGDAPRMNRNDQFEHTTKTDVTGRPLRLPSGEPNISGDWAQEQYVVAVHTARRLVPKSMSRPCGRGRSSRRTRRIPVGARDRDVHEARQREADAFRMWSPEDNPRLRCRPTSIIFDWVFDGAVNRITQEDDRIVINYGLFSFERVIHMNVAQHPANIEPSYAGHSIGRWDGDDLVVDTIGFEPGVIAAPVRNSDQLHVFERFSLDPKAMALTRRYVAVDPVYFIDTYFGSDTVLVADVPYEAHPCDELTPEFRAGQERKDWRREPAHARTGRAQNAYSSESAMNVSVFSIPGSTSEFFLIVYEATSARLPMSFALIADTAPCSDSRRRFRPAPSG